MSVGRLVGLQQKIPLGDCDSPDASDNSESEDLVVTIDISFIGGSNC